MKTVVQLKTPLGDRLWMGFNGDCKSPENCCVFDSQEAGTKAGNHLLGRHSDAFWRSEVEHQQNALKEYHGWEFLVVPVEDGEYTIDHRGLRALTEGACKRLETV